MQFTAGLTEEQIIAGAKIPDSAVMAWEKAMPAPPPLATTPAPSIPTQEDTEMIYKTVNDVPDWGRATVYKLMTTKGTDGN